MGQESEQAARLEDFRRYQVDTALLEQAAEDVQRQQLPAAAIHLPPGRDRRPS